jgi:CheY-like chemotaxis protein
MNPPSHSPFSASLSKPIRILVAEDDTSTRHALVSLLEHRGYEVTFAPDGQVALEILTRDPPPQVALLDWEMPRLSGLQLAIAARSIPGRRYLYLIMVTARDAPEDVLTAFAAGVDDFLAKPVDAAQLFARLRGAARVLALEERLEDRIAELEKTLGEVQQLKRLLPICMYCKRIRDDGEYWQEIETYLHDHTGSNFSHGICPSCMNAVVEPQLQELLDFKPSIRE